MAISLMGGFCLVFLLGSAEAGTQAAPTTTTSGSSAGGAPTTTQGIIINVQQPSNTKSLWSELGTLLVPLVAGALGLTGGLLAARSTNSAAARRREQEEEERIQQQYREGTASAIERLLEALGEVFEKQAAYTDHVLRGEPSEEERAAIAAQVRSSIIKARLKSSIIEDQQLGVHVTRFLESVNTASRVADTKELKELNDESAKIIGTLEDRASAIYKATVYGTLRKPPIRKGFSNELIASGSTTQYAEPQHSADEASD
jgi:hypothetical protein